ncbi:MAG: hypothetical protein BME93_04130 [Methanosarcinales archaeon Met12]|nr:MAG: hypothetical protein BME93_04130 [Methanosarcinales archaeon Met12]
MIKKYSQEHLLKLFRKLPQELKEMILSEETADNAYNIRQRYNIDSEIAQYIGFVLVGVLPPDEFQETLEKELGIKLEIAKKVD